MPILIRLSQVEIYRMVKNKVSVGFIGRLNVISDLVEFLNCLNCWRSWRYVFSQTILFKTYKYVGIRYCYCPDDTYIYHPRLIECLITFRCFYNFFYFFSNIFFFKKVHVSEIIHYNYSLDKKHTSNFESKEHTYFYIILTQNYCKTLGAHLPILDSQAKMDKLRQFEPNMECMYTAYT